MENKKNIAIYCGCGIGAVVIVLIIVFWFKDNKTNPTVTVGQKIEESIIPSTEDTSKGSVNIKKVVPTISYADALIKYKDARIQLDE
jgi:hypothetical protein